jgi:NAD(P)-dependent dehydrogenase (short-subunit alcohol dehydrogenase family)
MWLLRLCPQRSPNAAHQNRKASLDELDDEEFDRTFKTNVYAYFRLVKAALPHLEAGASIIVTGSERVRRARGTTSLRREQGRHSYGFRR